MVIRMSDGINEVEWRVADTSVFRYDAIGNHHTELDSYDDACAWVIAQASYLHKSKEYKFIK